jgi:sec-independent protein translocase protein TatB
MFDIGWSELVIIGVVALIVIGPKELPGVLRMAGQWIGKIRRMAADFQGQFQEAMREAEMADLKKQVDDLTNSTRDLTSQFDPIGSMQDAIDSYDGKPKAGRTATASTAGAADSTVPQESLAQMPAAAAETGPELPQDEPALPRKAAGGPSA